MTTDSERAFRRRILAGRTAALASRGVGPDVAAGRLPERLVCAAAGRLHAIDPATLLAVRPYGCQALPLISPSAAPSMLGVFSHSGQLYSLLDLAGLLGLAGGRAPAAGTMLLLKGSDRRVALRVDRVVGLLTLRAAGDDGRFGLLDMPERPAGRPDQRAEADAGLVSLVDPATIRDRIASLDRHSGPEFI